MLSTEASGLRARPAALTLCVSLSPVLVPVPLLLAYRAPRQPIQRPSPRSTFDSFRPDLLHLLVPSFHFRYGFVTD